MPVPVLCYHAMNVLGNEYDSNDHTALAEDLRHIHGLGFRIISLHAVVEALLAGRLDEMDKAVALSFDDGSWFDWHDLVHPTHGMQRSFANILRDFSGHVGPKNQRGLHATSFVIASPEAREILDRTCMVGRGWWSANWWREAIQENMIAIESHSYDHNHHTLVTTVAAHHHQETGTFKTVDCYADADAEIRGASDCLDGLIPGRKTSLFAYPYGETNDYLEFEYLPNFQHEHRLRAAFTTEPAPITRTSNRWALPRYVCGAHWRTPGELETILRGA